MGMMDKFLNAMRLNADDDDDFYDDEYYDDEEPLYEEEEPPKRHGFRRERDNRRDAEEDIAPRFTAQRESRQQQKSSSKVTPMRQSRRNSGSAGMGVCVIKPTSVEDAREITETLLNNRTVILNLEGIDLDIGQRIIDFTSGSCFAIEGNLQKISNYIFIATPASVDISGDFLNLMDGLNVSSIHMDI